MTRIGAIWLDRIEQDMIPEGQINQFVQAIMPLAKGRARIGGKDTNLTEDEAADIVAEAEMRWQNGGYLLEERHTVKGYEWLKANGKRADIPAEVISGFLHFRWIGTTLVGSGYQTAYLPKWEITYLEDGEKKTYAYSWSPYQTRMYA